MASVNTPSRDNIPLNLSIKKNFSLELKINLLFSLLITTVYPEIHSKFLGVRIMEDVQPD
jgi:hypothetical protein